MRNDGVIEVGCQIFGCAAAALRSNVRDCRIMVVVKRSLSLSRKNNTYKHQMRFKMTNDDDKEKRRAVDTTKGSSCGISHNLVLYSNEVVDDVDSRFLHPSALPHDCFSS